MHRFILEYLERLDKLLVTIERLGAIISRKKFNIGVDSLTIIRYYYDKDKRYPNIAKVEIIIS